MSFGRASKQHCASESFEFAQFQAKLERGLQHARKVLDAAKAPCYAAAADVHHAYEDKYLLSECMTNAAVASQLNSLTSLGLKPDQVANVLQWAQNCRVSLELNIEEQCKFNRKETREEESKTKQVDLISVGDQPTTSVTSKLVTTITEYFWTFEVKYALSIVRGVGQDPAVDRITLLQRDAQTELKTTSESAPRFSPCKSTPFSVDITWLLKQFQLNVPMSPKFQIDRMHADCHTPRRNPEINAALKHFRDVKSWAEEVYDYFRKQIFSVQLDSKGNYLDLNAVSDVSSVFVPILPLFGNIDQAGVAPSAAAAAQDTSVDTFAQLSPNTAAAGRSTLPCIGDLNKFLSEEMRSMKEKCGQLDSAFPSDGIVTSAEAKLLATLQHCSSVCMQWAESMDYIEAMLRKQLIAAIGKEVTPDDFAEYMRFHNRKLFINEYAPVPFCFAVRRSAEHSPEGTVSIEESKGGFGSDAALVPILTLSHRSSRPHPMKFPLNASTNVSFGGDRYLHACLLHQFSGDPGKKLSLVSRARQFSSFLVLVGRVTSAHSFDPKYAAIIQNKDELTIPLDLSTIPTPKEFKDAIESLSPEQQAFAKAFRSMQLESTLFGILVIQIKPQLEKVLNLPDDSLTKEIKLSQELMQLFIKYQIPTDLLSYDGTDAASGTEIIGATAAEKLDCVKSHVKAINELIEKSKEEEIENRRREAEYHNPAVRFGSAASWGSDESADSMMGGGGGMMMMRGAPTLQSRTYAAPAMAECMAESRACCAAAAPAPAAAAAACFGAPPPPAPGGGGLFGGAPSRALKSRASPSSAPSGGGLFGAAKGGSLFGSPVQQTSAQGTTSQAPQEQSVQQRPSDASGADAAARREEGPDVRDYTQVPREIDASFEALDMDNAARPTIITPGETWSKKAQKALLAATTSTLLNSSEQKKEKDAAFDLLDALTKSGGLPIENASLHIVVCATHCFDKTVTETLVQKNKNPIDKVECSTLIMAKTIYQQPVSALIQDAQQKRVQEASPQLFP